MATYYYKKASNPNDVRPFSDVTWTALGGTNSGWIKLTDQEVANLNVAPDQSTEPTFFGIVSTPIMVRVEKYADAVFYFTRFESGIVFVDKDESPDNIGSMPDGSNPSTIYSFMKNNPIQLLYYPKAVS